MAGLSTHVLDNVLGRPAVGMRIDFSSIEHGVPRLLRTLRANADGRTDEPVLAAAEMRKGEFELVFHVADYFRSWGLELPEPPFLDRVPIRFAIAETTAHYHVPLLCTPWSYSTYRGS